MEYGEVVRLEVQSNLILKEKERADFLSRAEVVDEFVGAVKIKPGDAKRREKMPLERIVIPGSALRKDKSIPSYRLEEILVMPNDIEGRETFVLSPAGDNQSH